MSKDPTFTLDDLLAAEDRGYARAMSEMGLDGADAADLRLRVRETLMLLDRVRHVLTAPGYPYTLPPGHADIEVAPPPRPLSAAETPKPPPLPLIMAPPVKPARKPQEPRAAAAPRVDAGGDPDAALAGKGGYARAFRVLAECRPKRLTETQWGMLTGLKTSGGTWGTYKSRLRTAGLIDSTADGFGVTEKGARHAAELGIEPRKMTRDQILSLWARPLGSGPMKLLQVMLENPQGISRDSLAASAQLSGTGGTFTTYLSRLTSSRLAFKAGGDLYRPSAELL